MQVSRHFRNVQKSSGKLLDGRRSGFVPGHEGLGEAIRCSFRAYCQSSGKCLLKGEGSQNFTAIRIGGSKSERRVLIESD